MAWPLSSLLKTRWQLLTSCYGNDSDSPHSCGVTTQTVFKTVHIGWQWRNFVPYPCQLVFAAIIARFVYIYSKYSRKVKFYSLLWLLTLLHFLYRFGSVSVRTVWKTDFTELLIRNVTWHWSSSLFRLHFVCSSKFLAVTEYALILDNSLYFSLFLFILFSQIYFSYAAKNQCNSVPPPFRAIILAHSVCYWRGH